MIVEGLSCTPTVSGHLCSSARRGGGMFERMQEGTQMLEMLCWCPDSQCARRTTRTPWLQKTGIAVHRLLGIAVLALHTQAKVGAAAGRCASYTKSSQHGLCGGCGPGAGCVRE